MHKLDGASGVHPIVASYKNQKRQSPVSVRLSDAPSAPPATSPARRHNAYFEFSQKLVLAHAHRADLRTRGFTDAQIDARGYKSMPGKIFAANLINSLSGSGLDFNSVPGFYFDRRRGWQLVSYAGATGFLIPIRNHRQMIIGLQLRRDDDRQPRYLLVSSANYHRGASSGAPPHFAYPLLGHGSKFQNAEEIIITEGVLKADAVAALSATATVGLVGVSTFDETLPEKLKEAFPNLKSAQIAFDMDRDFKPEVSMQLDRLSALLEGSGITPQFLRWDAKYKGLDDFLNFQRQNGLL